MKKTLSIFFFLLSIFFCNAQKEFWGTMLGSPTYPYYGFIFKTDFDGQNQTPVFNFNDPNAVNGKHPESPLFLASNGKIYGTTREGGIFFGPIELDTSGGVLFEYDLILNKYTVLTRFGDSQSPFLRKPLYSGVIEPTIGTLTGTIYSNGTFKFDINTNSIIESAILPVFFINGQSFHNELTGGLTKASNGFIYCTTQHFSSNLGANPYIGSIAKINFSTNSFNIIYPLNPNSILEGQYPNGDLIEGSPNILYGTTIYGGDYAYTPSNPSNLGGVLFEYNIMNNTYTKKISFNNDTIGSSPNPLAKGQNGKLYGTAYGGGVNAATGANYSGTLYEYDTTTNTLTVLHRFTDTPPAALYKLVIGSDGKLYIPTQVGIFKYDLTTNTLTEICVIDFNNFLFYSKINNIIEICRKPSYQEIVVNSFTINTGSNYSYDVHNTNATTYQWQQNGVNVAGQTTGVINLTNVTTANAGVYTCVMTNECGTTITAPLTITVSNLGLNEVEASLEGIVKLYPNPSNNYINIELPTNIDVKINTIKINDVLGKERLLRSDKLEGMTKVDVSNLSKGVYIVTIQTTYGDWNGKFVKE